jgi:hypothetical protein
MEFDVILKLMGSDVSLKKVQPTTALGTCKAVKRL